MKRTVPLLLGLAAYCTLADSFRRLKRRGRRCEMRHAGRVSVEYFSTLSIDADDVVEDKRRHVGLPRVLQCRT
jgi:hypothetical protein